MVKKSPVFKTPLPNLQLSFAREIHAASVCTPLFSHQTIKHTNFGHYLVFYLDESCYYECLSGCNHATLLGTRERCARLIDREISTTLNSLNTCKSQTCVEIVDQHAYLSIKI